MRELGNVQVVWSYQNIPVFPNSATISRNAAGRWFISLQSVGDYGWYELRWQLAYKAQWYRQLNIVPKFQRTTGICSECGTVGKKLPLSVWTWMCEHCGGEHDRDIAAARVIGLMGNTVRRTGMNACGLARTPAAVNVD